MTDHEERDYIMQRTVEQTVESVREIALGNNPLTGQEARLVWLQVIQKLLESVEIDRRTELVTERMGLLSRVPPPLPSERNCPFYGVCLPVLETVTVTVPVIMPTGGNQCGFLRDRHAPCQMEINGKVPDWRTCDLLRNAGHHK